MSAETYQLVLRRRVIAAEGGMGQRRSGGGASSWDSAHLVDLRERRGELSRDVHGERVTVTGSRKKLAKLQGSVKSDALERGVGTSQMYSVRVLRLDGR